MTIDISELLVPWVFLCVVIGLFASARGLNGFSYFALSLLLSPLIGGIAVLLAKPPAKEVVATMPSIGSGSVADEIGKLAALKDAGHLTPEEFERQKAALLGGPVSTGAQRICVHCGKPVAPDRQRLCNNCGLPFAG